MVYQILCECGSVYIGETGRQLKTRRTQGSSETNQYQQCCCIPCVKIRPRHPITLVLERGRLVQEGQGGIVHQKLFVIYSSSMVLLPVSFWARDHPVFEGVQQGDPLGPLLFCFMIHNMVQQLCSQLNVFSLNDGTLGGSLEGVLYDFHSVEHIAGKLGLQLNLGKTEIICRDTRTMNTMFQEVPGLCVSKRERTTLLGSPIGDIEGVRDTRMVFWNHGE